MKIGWAMVTEEWLLLLILGLGPLQRHFSSNCPPKRKLLHQFLTSLSSDMLKVCAWFRYFSPNILLLIQCIKRGKQMQLYLQGNTVVFNNSFWIVCSYPAAEFDFLYPHCDKGQSGRTRLDVSDGPQTSGGEMWYELKNAGRANWDSV